MTDRNPRPPAVRAALLLLVACAILAVPGRATAQQTAPQEPDEQATGDQAAAQPGGEPQGPRLVAIPKIDHAGLEPAVGRQLEEVDAALELLLARASGQGETPPSAAEVAAGFGDLGRHYQAYGLDDAAAACYHNAAELSPQDPRWPHLLGRALQQAGRLPQAVEAYRRALELAPNDLPALVYLAEVRTLQGRPEEAAGHYRAAVALDPDSPAALAGLGQAALDAGDAGEAVARLEAALAAQPAADRLHYPLGLAYRALGNEEKARENLLAAGNVGVRPVDPLVDDLEQLKSGERVHLLRGHMAFRAGDYGAAADAYHRALQQAPESVAAHVDLATALSRLGYLEGAEERLREALTLAPENANTHYNLGALLARNGNAPGAGVHLRRAISLDPEDGAAHLALAETLAAGSSEEAGDAVFHYRKAAELGLRDARVYLGEAALHLRAGEFAAAQERLALGYERVPESVDVLVNLARLTATNPQLDQRDGELAHDLAERAYAAQRSVFNAETVAAALGELGRCEEAAEWQQKAIDALESQQASEQAESLRPLLEIYRSGPPCRYPDVTAAAQPE
jgi:tetratricopeptide (TPR) repeat protein